MIVASPFSSETTFPTSVTVWDECAESMLPLHRGVTPILVAMFFVCGKKIKRALDVEAIKFE